MTTHPRYVTEFNRVLTPAHHAIYTGACTRTSPAQRERYLAKWRGEAIPAPPPRAKAEALPACPHLGAPTGETVGCKTCSGTVRLKVFGCSVHGTCTIGKKVAGVAGCCRGCSDRPTTNTDSHQLTPTHTPPAPRPTDPPRVLFVTHDLSRSGAPTLLLSMVTRLRGVRPTLFSFRDGPLRQRFEEAGVRVVVGDRPDPAGYDLVVANTMLSAGAVKAAKSAGVPCVWLIHESGPLMHGPGVLAGCRVLWDYPAAVVFPSADLATLFKGLPARRVEVIPTLIPPVPVRDREACRAALGWKPDEFVVVSLGRDEKRKGQADIRAAVAGLAGVRFVPVTDSPDPHTYLAAADLYVCSSRAEAFPLAVQEAAAHGLPVVSTPAGLLSGVKAETYEPGDVAGLRRLIEGRRASGRVE